MWSLTSAWVHVFLYSQVLQDGLIFGARGFMNLPTTKTVGRCRPVDPDHDPVKRCCVPCLQGCTDARVMACFGALRAAVQADVLERTAREDGVPAAGAVTAPLTNAVEWRRQAALQRRAEHEWLGDCSTLPVRPSAPTSCLSHTPWRCLDWS